MSQSTIQDTVVVKLPETATEFYKKGRREWFAHNIRPLVSQFAFDQWFSNTDSKPLAKIMQNMNIYDRVYLDKTTLCDGETVKVEFVVIHRLYLNDDLLSTWIFKV